MKPYQAAALIGLALIAWSLSSCVTTETTVRSPDGTVTTTRTSGPDAASVAVAADAVAVAAAQIIPDK